jgi:formylglycine-generating enzyme required for sulfatase activity
VTDVLKIIVSLAITFIVGSWLLSPSDESANLPDKQAHTTDKQASPGPPPPEEGAPSDRYRCDPGGRGQVDCFRWIPGGKFQMGAQSSDPTAPAFDPKAGLDESPPHLVELTGFWIQPLEVQLSRYRNCIDKQLCASPSYPQSGYFRLASTSRSGSVNGVHWSEAQTYCEHLGGRLPTEAEWEYAARGPDNNRFPWGNEVHCADGQQAATLTTRAKDWPTNSPGNQDNTASDWEEANCSHRQPPEQMGHRSEPFALRQLAGGMWEWVYDYYGEDYYADSPRKNPSGPEVGTKRVQRGGGWMSDRVWDFRSAARASLDPEMRLPDVGFRCVYTGGPVTPGM